MRAGVLTPVAIATAMALGCASPPPAYQWKDHETALRLMAERASRLQTLQSEARLVLTSRDGQSMTLDAAIAAAPPDGLRLRAWKLGHAVLDLTHTSEGTWLKSEEAPPRRDSPGPDLRTLDARSLADAWSIVTGDLLRPPGDASGSVAETIDKGGPTFTVRRTLGSPAANQAGASVMCDIDRRTLTVRRCRIMEGGAERGLIKLDGYRDFDGIAFPTRINAAGAEGSVLLLLLDPEFNLPLAPGAFEPPAGATRQE